MKKGFDFTLMVAGEWSDVWVERLRPGVSPDLTQISPGSSWPGESGLGKSTLVHSLFLTDLYKDRKLLSAEGE